MSTREKDGAPVWHVSRRVEVRATPTLARFTERGFEGEARIAGHMATVSLPYDFYRDGRWSHCGIDVFTLVQTPEGWRIATLRRLG